MASIDFSKRVDYETEKIEKAEGLSERDKELLLEFKRDLKLDGCSDSWVHKLLNNLRVMGRRMSMGFEEAERDDIKDLVEWVQDRDIADATKRDYRKILKRFYRWLNDGEFPSKVEWINTTRKHKSKKLPKQMLTEEDIEKLINAARNPRDRALIAMLWETGARIGELLDLKIGDIEDREHGKKVVVDGKTGQRRLPLISSLPHLNQWLSNHPSRNDMEAPLWVRINGQKAGEEVGYRYVVKALKKTRDRSEVNKPVNPHHFRHSRATYLASKFTESQMCEWFGWVQGSDRPQTYVHMSGRDIDSTYDQLHGIEEKESPEKSEMTPQECPRCGELNNPEAEFCQKCGQALNREAFEMISEKRKKADEVQKMFNEWILENGEELFKEFVKRPEVQEKLSKIKKENLSVEG